MVEFHQCRFGATTVLHKTPIMKATKFMTNSAEVAEAFSGKYCLGDHVHQQLQGHEGGRARTAAAAAYPAQVVETLVDALTRGGA